VKKTKIGGNLGERLKTDFDLKYRKEVPGPGTYKLGATEIGNGTYFLSTYKYTYSHQGITHLLVTFHN